MVGASLVELAGQLDDLRGQHLEPSVQVGDLRLGHGDVRTDRDQRGFTREQGPSDCRRLEGTFPRELQGDAVEGRGIRIEAARRDGGPRRAEGRGRVSLARLLDRDPLQGHHRVGSPRSDQTLHATRVVGGLGSQPVALGERGGVGGLVVHEASGLLEGGS